jgi:glutathione S-transferase
MVMMKLLGSPNSPFVRKVRVVAAEKAIPIDYVIDRPSAPGSQVPTLNPLGKIPLLVLDNAEVIYDSAVIAEYLDGLKPEPRLIPADFAGRIAVKRWEALGDGVAETVVTISHDFGPMNDLSRREGWMPKQFGKVERSLAAFDAAVRGRDWLYGDAFSFADICAGYALFYADKELSTLPWRRDYRALASYAERLAARPSFRDTVPDAA